MSQDSRFVDIFLLVLGVLIAITVGIYVLSSQISDERLDENVRGDHAYQAQVLERIRPLGAVLLPGEEPPEGEAQPQARVSAPAPVEEQLTGPQVYNQACLACHGAGIGGAPTFGEAEAWAPRIAKGVEVLYDHSINGFQGSAGYMPPKGGRMDLSDEEVRAAVDYMVAEAQ